MTVGGLVLFIVMVAQIFQSAVCAVGALGMADTPSVIYEVVVCLGPFALGKGIAQTLFDLGGSFPFRKPEPV